MRADLEQELAHTLLIELLAYQFTYPVRWIETQDVILGEQQTQRLVEVGPGNTLVNMAKNTLKERYTSFDTALSLKRELLSQKSNVREIYYKSGSDAIAEALVPPAKITDTPTSSPSIPEPALVQERLRFPAPEAAVADVAVSVSDVLWAILAHHTRKDVEDITESTTIKALAAGRSTLQNEVIGDIEKEFGRQLADQPEELPLEALVSSLAPTFTGQLGLKSKQLIDRMITAKMNAGFKTSAARSYLHSHWGFQQGRQDATLLLAATMQPPSRLNTETQVRSFFDEVVTKYAVRMRLELTKPTSVALPVPVNNSQMNSSGSQRLDQLDYAGAQRKLRLCAEELGLDLHGVHTATTTLKDDLERIQADLDLWLDEHGAEYATGILPKFTPAKVRVYDSWWNWGLQQLWCIFHDMRNGKIAPTSLDVTADRTSITNRSDPRILDALCFIQSSLRGKMDFDFVKEFINNLLDDTKLSLSQPSKFRLATLEDSHHPCYGRTEYEARDAVWACRNAVRPTWGTSCLCSSNARERIGIGRRRKSSHSLHGCGSWNQVSILTRSAGHTGWFENRKLSHIYKDATAVAARDGLSFENSKILITGAGPGSIGSKVLENLLRGGAHVLVTTSSNISGKTADFFRDLYVDSGGKGSRLILVPFNQASTKDLNALVDYICDTDKGLGWDLDHVIPFAAVTEGGREIDEIDSRSELAHRLMLTNTVRLLGAIKRKKESTGSINNPAQVLLPLSPNHGMFGGDGLYSESKLGLESLLGKWHSESWAHSLSMCGVLIGWTRGTGLMAANDGLVDVIEDIGINTFSQQEMADYLVVLMSATMLDCCQDTPIMVDLTGGMGDRSDMSDIIGAARADLNHASSIRQALLNDADRDHQVARGDCSRESEVIYVKPRSSLRFDFPHLESRKTMTMSASRLLDGMVDLSRVAVVVGFSESGPLGNARTRWDIEVNGEYSTEGCIELAWMTGLIKQFNGTIDGKEYCGWVEVKGNRPVLEAEVKPRFGAELLSRSGVRLVKEASPQADVTLQEIAVEQDLEPFQASKQEALRFKSQHGDLVEVRQNTTDDSYQVFVKKGAIIHITKERSPATRVAGQLPDGWDPRVYGIPQDLVDRLDPIAIYSLVGTVEALLSAGITDPYELYNYIHLSEVGNCLGSGIGGMQSLRGIFRDRMMEKDIPSDVLQESFLNTPAAWINMLLMSAAGPIKTQVGACATALESLDTGCDLIASGKAKFCLVGGVDDLSPEVSTEFAHMKATINADADLGRGRSYAEMSRPATSSRAGFVESHGCGIQVLASAELAIKMGLPIYGVIAWTGVASDKAGRSVPAPGKGLTTFSRELRSSIPSPMLDLRYRRRLLDLRCSFITQSVESELLSLRDFCKAYGMTKDSVPELEEERLRIVRNAEAQRKEAVNACGNDFWKEQDSISPIRGALAVWGLSIDNLNVASFHGTSTVKGDENEIEVINEQLEYLGRTPGNSIMGIFQKYLTGHPKAPAGAWMLNGCLQVLNSGTVPGNRNADNIDESLSQYEHVLIPNRNIHVGHVDSFSVSSFGFGQKGSQAIGVHPKYALAVLDDSKYEDYREKVAARHRKAYRRFHEAIIQNDMFTAKEAPPYPVEDTLAVLKDPRPPLG